MSEEKYYSFQEALLLSGMEEARFLYLEKEFGPYIGLKNALLYASVYSAGQIAILRKIEALLRQGARTVEDVKHKISSFIALREKGMWVAAVTSGKGGVGKTSISVNLSVAMARMGLRPVLVDADLGLANAHLLLGLLPKLDLQDLILGRAGMEDILIKTRYGVSLVPGGSGITSLADLDDDKRESLAQEVKKLYYHADSMIIDTGSGISSNVMTFLRLADEIIVVVTPNVASCVDALGVIRAALEEGCPGRINVLVNRCLDEEEARSLFCKLYRSIHGLTGRSAWYLGHVPEDPRMEQSFQRGMPVTSLSSSCRASRQIRHIARFILSDKRDVEWKENDRIIRIFGGINANFQDRQSGGLEINRK